MVKEDNLVAFGAIMLVLLIAVYIILCPFISIVLINYFFSTDIPYTLKTWFFMILIGIINSIIPAIFKQLND